MKCMILIAPCCRTFENATTRLKDSSARLNHAATRLSYKPLFQCPNQSQTAESTLWEKTEIKR